MHYLFSRSEKFLLDICFRKIVFNRDIFYFHMLYIEVNNYGLFIEFELIYILSFISEISSSETSSKSCISRVENSTLVL